MTEETEKGSSITHCFHGMTTNTHSECLGAAITSMELNVDSEAEMEKAGPDHDYWVPPKTAAMAKEMAN